MARHSLVSTLLLSLAGSACAKSRPAPAAELALFFQKPELEQKATFITLDPRTQFEIAHAKYWGEPRNDWFAAAMAGETHLLPFLHSRLREATDDGQVELIAWILQHMAARYADVGSNEQLMDDLRRKGSATKSELIGSQVSGWVKNIEYFHLNVWSTQRH